MEGKKSVQVVSCATFDEFVRAVREENQSHGYHQVLFRGQQDAKWKLESHWERWVSQIKRFGMTSTNEWWCGESGVRAIRRQWLEEFRKLVVGMPGVPHEILEDDVQLWAFGRHYGLITPLLDWTESPFVAVFFAFFDRLKCTSPGLGQTANFGNVDVSNDPVAVWELRVDDELNNSSEFKVFTSRHGRSERQKAQAGCFTFLDHDSITDLEEYLCQRGLIGLLRRYEIPGGEWSAALFSLAQMNIRYSSLFPDLEGASIESNMVPLLRNLGNISNTMAKVRQATNQ